MFAHHTDRFMTEKELIVSLKQGDEAAFTALYRMYWPKVHNFSRLYPIFYSRSRRSGTGSFRKIVGGTYLSERE